MPRVRTNTNQTIPAEAASFTRPLRYDPTLAQAAAAAPDPNDLFGAAPLPLTAMEAVRVARQELTAETISNYTSLSIADVDRLIVHRNPPFLPTDAVQRPVFPPDVPRVAGRPAIGHRDGMGRGGTSDPNMILTRSRAIHPSSFYSLIPTEAQAEQITAISLAAEQFANTLDAALECSMEKDRILRKVREVALWARDNVLRYVDGTPREMCSLNIPDLGEANTGAAGATVRPEPATDQIDPRARFSDIANGRD